MGGRICTGGSSTVLSTSWVWYLSQLDWRGGGDGGAASTAQQRGRLVSARASAEGGRRETPPSAPRIRSQVGRWERGRHGALLGGCGVVGEARALGACLLAGRVVGGVGGAGCRLRPAPARPGGGGARSAQRIRGGAGDSDPPSHRFLSGPPALLDLRSGPPCKFTRSSGAGTTCRYITANKARSIRPTPPGLISDSKGGTWHSSLTFGGFDACAPALKRRTDEAAGVLPPDALITSAVRDLRSSMRPPAAPNGGVMTAYGVSRQ
jgi:hypothetical protein